MILMFLSLYDVNFVGRRPHGRTGRPSDDQTIKPCAQGLMIGSSSKAMVGRGGLEPPTSRLSGVRSNHLSYRPILRARHRRPAGVRGVGGAYRDRTDDLLNANQVLSQLS